MTHLKPTWHIFIDGASRGNPGQSGAGIFITAGRTSLLKHGFYLGIKTNNQAEYLALALALYFAGKLSDAAKEPRPLLNIISDSQLLIRQMTGHYKVKDARLKRLRLLIDSLAKDFRCTYTHVLRDKNTIADALANEGIDEKHLMPDEFVALFKRHAG